MPEYVIAVGSNIDPDVHVPAGLSRLNRIGSIVRTSEAYRTPAVARDGSASDQGEFWNLLVVLQAPHDGITMRSLLREIEALEGRVRGDDKWAARELDLDILTAAPTGPMATFWQARMAEIGVSLPFS